MREHGRSFGDSTHKTAGLREQAPAEPMPWVRLRCYIVLKMESQQQKKLLLLPNSEKGVRENSCKTAAQIHTEPEATAAAAVAARRSVVLDTETGE